MYLTVQNGASAPPVEVMGLTLSPASVAGGGAVQGTVSLSAAAPASPVSSNQTATITASYGGGSAQATLTVTGGGVMLPPFTEIEVTAKYSANQMTGVGLALVFPSSSSGFIDGVMAPDFEAEFGTVTVAGNTFTLSGVIVGSNSFMSSGLQTYGITTGSATITLAPSGDPAVGTVTGTFTLTSALETLTGTISGSYVGVQ